MVDTSLVIEASDRLDAIDVAIELGDIADALAQIGEWLPSATAPDVRRDLLIRKGRALLAREDSKDKEVLLALKGALILEPDAADTRFELFRAYVRSGDTRRADDQLKELVALYPEDVDGSTTDLPSPKELSAQIFALGTSKGDRALQRALKTVRAAREWLADAIESSD